jgi:hypothetical protein
MIKTTTTECNPLSSTDAKWDRPELLCIGTKSDLSRKKESYPTTWKYSQLNVCFHFAYILFYFTDIYGQTSHIKQM